jgi:uncharacterized protein
VARGRRLGRKRPAEPLRRCLGCRETKPKASLLRVAAKDGKAVPDLAHRLSGRGAWLCRNAACAKAVNKGRQVSRALKGKATEPTADELSAWIRLNTEAGSAV